MKPEIWLPCSFLNKTKFDYKDIKMTVAFMLLSQRIVVTEVDKWH